MDRKPEIEKKLLDLFQEFSPKIEVANDAYHLSVSFGEKKAEMIWPYPLHEVSFDFWDGDSKVLSDSFEFYEGESDSELVEYLGTVLNRFLNHETRVHVKGRLFKITELQYQQGGVWNAVFQDHLTRPLTSHLSAPDSLPCAPDAGYGGFGL